MARLDTYFAKCLPVALAKEMRSPLRSVTVAPMAIFPNVACRADDSINAKYIQPTTMLTRFVMSMVLLLKDLDQQVQVIGLNSIGALAYGF